MSKQYFKVSPFISSFPFLNLLSVSAEESKLAREAAAKEANLAREAAAKESKLAREAAAKESKLAREAANLASIEVLGEKISNLLFYPTLCSLHSVYFLLNWIVKTFVSVAGLLWAIFKGEQSRDWGIAAQTTALLLDIGSILLFGRS
jgi:hypothetical protein